MGGTLEPIKPERIISDQNNEIEELKHALEEIIYAKNLKERKAAIKAAKKILFPERLNKRFTWNGPAWKSDINLRQIFKIKI